MDKVTKNLLEAAEEVVSDFNRFGEVLQQGDNGEYGTESAIGRLAAAATSKRKQLGDVETRAKVKIEEDHCPMCGCEELNYGTKDWHDEQYCQECTCQTCGFVFKQWCAGVFRCMTVLVEGDNIEIESPEIEER